MAINNLFTIVIIFAILCNICDMKQVRFPPDTIEFFPDIQGNLTKLSWAHAVNNVSYLESVLEDDSIMMIEADVVLGCLKGLPCDEEQPIMGHPPATVSDITLQQFLEAINQANENHSRADVPLKGVKLDFKSIEVFEQSLHIVHDQYNKVNYPFWINADILPGPVNSTTTPVDAERFLKATSPYKHALLSIGWTTKYGGNIKDATYSDDQISDMISTLENSGSRNSVTFPVRAGIAANSRDQMIRLLNQTNSHKSTLTIWSSDGDFVNIEKLRTLIYDCGIDRVYLDVPTAISDQLHL